jgi:hypothetical protein
MLAGVVNLYTREFFQLVYDRLAEGGIATYWLPLHDLSDASSKNILRAFCDVFEHCSLWQGHSSNLMMVGTRGNRSTVSLEHFEAQWRDPRVGPELRSLGLERPEQLGALFIGDAKWIREITADSPALVDDQPNRLFAEFTGSDASLLSRYPYWSVRRPAAYLQNVHKINFPNQTYEAFVFVGPEAETRFEHSEQIRRLFPPAMIAGSKPYFAVQRLLADISNGRPFADSLLVDMISRGIMFPALLTLGSNPDIQAAILRIPDNHPEIQLHRAINELVHGLPDDALVTLAADNSAAAKHVKAVAALLLLH